MLFVLQNTVVLGLITNQSFLLNIMKNSSFISGVYNTLFIEKEFSFLFQRKEGKDLSLQKENDLVIIPFLWLWYQRERKRTTLRHIPSGWRYLKNKNPIDGYYIDENLIELEYEYHKIEDESFINNTDYMFSIWIKLGEEKRKDVILHDVITNENDSKYFQNEF